MAECDPVLSRPDAELVRRAARYSTATLAEAIGKSVDLPAAIKPISAKMRVCGPAITVDSPPADNLMLHQALYVAMPGDVLIAAVSGHYEAGYWGEIMTHAALHRQIAGLVMDGCVRDAEVIEQMGFPVFARGLCIRGTAKRGGGLLNRPITIGEVVIQPGDLVVGDRDGVVVIAQLEIKHVLAQAERRMQKEKWVKSQLAAGKTTLEIYEW